MKMMYCTLLGTLAIVSMIGGPAVAEDVRVPVHVEGNKPIAPYSPGIKLANGMLFVSGQIPYVNGEIPEAARNDVAAQTRIVMENLQSVLNEAGYSFDDVVRATVFMTDMKNYGAFNKVYGTYWGDGSVPPARAAVEVGALPGSKPGAPVLVEVSMIAAK
ncbi:RidA family protein [Roseibium sp. MMSF_3412]|uniref:RidA family protein n=1 Tax=Roseibium sp. MMSF_3412 TaxID=3046712 RepID=UPI00273CFBCD|nr:Rid family hydrolase [Roseibium sp. MMSF_3412]